MVDTPVMPELLEFFKALAEPKRLRIVGLLAQQAYTGEQLAAMLELSEGTISHHLSYLVHAGLVAVEPRGYYNTYSLKLDAIHAIAERLLSRDELPKLAADVDVDAYDRKVLGTFTDTEGRIKQFPAQRKKFEVLLRYVLKAFEPGVRYTEKQVNEILSAYNEDAAYLRRSLVECKYMAREGGGGAYWRIDQPETQMEG
jgi:biotin operon repressor